MTEFTKEIIEGINLDDALDSIGEAELIDAVNVSHHTDERMEGDLRPSLGVSHTGFTYRNAIKTQSMEASLAAFTDGQTSQVLDTGTESLIVKYHTPTGSPHSYTHFYRVTTDPDYVTLKEPGADGELGPFRATQYIVTDLYMSDDAIIDEGWQSTWHTYQGTFQYFFCRKGHPFYVLTAAEDLETTFAPFTSALTQDMFPQVRVTGFRSEPSLIRPSVTQYTYRIKYFDGGFESFVPLCDPITIPGDYPRTGAYEETEDWSRPELKDKIKSKLKIELEIDFGAQPINNAVSLEVYAVRYIDDSMTPIVELIATPKYKKKLIIVDGETSKPSAVDILDIQLSYAVGNETFNACHVKDDVLYVANTTQEAIQQFQSDWDPRIWQFNAEQNCVDEGGHEYTFNEIIVQSPQPERFTQNVATDGADSSTFSEKRACLFQEDGVTYGASGRNIELGIVCGKMDYGNIYPAPDPKPDGSYEDIYRDSGDMLDPCYRFSSTFTGLCAPSEVVGLSAEDIKGQWISKNTNEGIPANYNYSLFLNANSPAPLHVINFAPVGRPSNAGHSFANPLFSSLFAAMQHDSVYRLGIKFYLANQITDVYYMGDIRTPSLNTDEFKLFEHHVRALTSVSEHYTFDGIGTDGYEVSQYVELRFFPLYLQIRLSNLSNEIKKVEILYAKRTGPDRNVITTGVMHRNLNPFGSNTAALKNKLKNDFWANGKYWTLPPLPTLGQSRYYFGGINSMAGTDWTNCLYRWDSAGTWDTPLPEIKKKGLGKGLAARTWMFHNSPENLVIQFMTEKTVYDRILLTEKGGGNHEVIAHVYISAPVIINSVSTEKKAYLFYAPELDLTDVSDKPLFHSITENHSLVSKISLHAILSSLFPCGRTRDILSCIHSENNINFSGEFTSAAPSKTPYSESRHYLTDDTTVCRHLIGKVGTLKAENINYDGIVQTFPGPYRFRQPQWAQHSAILTTNVTHYMDVRRTENGTSTTNTIQGSMPLKVLKFFIPSINYKVNGVARSLYLNSMQIIGKAFITNSFLRSSKDLFHFLFPCSVFPHAAAYPNGDMPPSPNTTSSGGTVYINICPLWSGEYNPRALVETSSNGLPQKGAGGSVASLGEFDVDWFITQMSAMNRNHYHVCWWHVNGHNTHIPTYWSNPDAGITPLSDHGMKMKMLPADEKNEDGDIVLMTDKMENTPPYSISAPVTIVIKGSEASDDPEVAYGHLDQYKINYDISTVPDKGTAVFPDVVWDEYVNRTSRTPRKTYCDCVGAIHNFIIHLLGGQDPSFFDGLTVLASVNETGGNGILANEDLSDRVQEECKKFSRNFLQSLYEKKEDALRTSDETLPQKVWDGRANGALSVNFSSGLNFTGYGGNSLLLTFDTADEGPYRIPGENFGINFTKKTNHSCDFLNDKVHLLERPAAGETGIFNYADLVQMTMDKGVHVLFASLRNCQNPYQNTDIDSTEWMSLSSRCMFAPDAEWHPLYGFDTFVGVHKRMYMNAFYPDGFGVSGEGAYPASSPIRMMFPYEGAINVDVANLTDELDNKDNPGGASKLRRISQFGGMVWKVGAGTYTARKPTFSYNTVYSTKIANEKNVTALTDTRKNIEHVSTIKYSVFDSGTGRFGPFRPGNEITVDSQMGGINVLSSYMQELYIGQERGICTISPKQQTLLQNAADEKRNIYIGTAGLLDSKPIYLSNTYGASQGARAFSNQDGVFWADIPHDAILFLGSNSIENIAAGAKIKGYMHDLRMKFGLEVPVWPYRIKDGNIRFQFGYDPIQEKGVDRRILEWNGEIKRFASFNTMADFDAMVIKGRGVFIARGLLFGEGTYNSWAFFKDLDVPPSITNYVNPTKDLHDKHFISCVLPQRDYVTSDVILDLDFEYYTGDKIKRRLAFMHYKKVQEAYHGSVDLENKEDFTSTMKSTKVTLGMPRIWKNSQDGTPKVLGRGVPYGRMLSMALDQVHNFETGKKKEGGPLLGKGFKITSRFQTYNPNCLDEIGRTPDSNANNESTHLGRRSSFYFLPLHVQYVPNPKS